MFGRGFVSLAAVAALALFAGQAFAQDEDPPPYVAIPNPESPLVPIPKEVEDRLPGNPQQRHPWVPGECGGDDDGCPVPLLYAAVEGSFKYDAKPNGEVFSCLLSVAAEHPNWESRDLRRVEYYGGFRCTKQIDASGLGGLRLYNQPTVYTLADEDIKASKPITSGASAGQWESSTEGFHDRPDTTRNQNVWMRITMTIPDWLPNAKWDTLASDCVRESARQITCTLNGPSFQNLPYPCDRTNALPPSYVGLQPGGCEAHPQPCSPGQYGVQPYCAAPPEQTEYVEPQGCGPAGNVGVNGPRFPDHDGVQEPNPPTAETPAISSDPTGGAPGDVAGGEEGATDLPSPDACEAGEEQLGESPVAPARASGYPFPGCGIKRLNLPSRRSDDLGRDQAEPSVDIFCDSVVTGYVSWDLDICIQTLVESLSPDRSGWKIRKCDVKYVLEKNRIVYGDPTRCRGTHDWRTFLRKWRLTYKPRGKSRYHTYPWQRHGKGYNGNGPAMGLTCE